MADDMDLLDGMLDSDDGEELDLNESPSKAALPAKGKADALVEKKAQPKKGLAKGAKAGSSSGNTVGMDAADGERLWARTQEKINAPSTGEGNNIVVVTRVRPFNKREKELNTTNCIQIHASDPDNHQVWISDPGAKDPNAEPSAFRFDYCFDSFDPGGSTGTFVDQKQVFEAVGLDILAKAWSGYHACLFAYGQTGSGKTYSIMGYGEDKGVIPRVCDALFYFIASQGAKAGTAQFKVDASYLEVYNETITDLLCPPPKEIEFVPLKPKERIKMEAKLKKLKKESPKEVAEMAKRESAIAELSALLDPEEAARQATAVLPKIREDPDKGVVVDNLKHFAVATFEDCNKLLEEGLANRTTGSTAMNASSSRSHCVFTLELQQLGGTKATSKITLIDLAGSEKTQTAKTEGQGLVEGININKSLSCLGACIAGLAKAAAKRDKEEAAKTPEQRAEEAKTKAAEAAKKEAAAAKAQKKAAAKGPSKYGVKTGAPPKSVEKSEDFIPFRDSVLTWILRDSLCGNSKTVMLAALSPAAANYQETLSTLRFAAQAKLLRTKAIVNEDPVQRLVAELKAEVEKLKQEASQRTVKAPPEKEKNGKSTASKQEEDYRTSKETAMLIQQKEEEVAKRIADSVASREKEWAEREANMNALLNERELAAKAAQAEALAAAAEAKERLMEVEKASKQQQAEAVKMAEEARVAARAAALAEAEAAAARRQGGNNDNGNSSATSPAALAALAQQRSQRRRVSVLHQSSVASGDNDPYLTVLSRDASISRTVRITVDNTGGRKLRIGRPGSVGHPPQDLEVDGVGIAAETCVVWAPTASSAIGAASKNNDAKKKSLTSSSTAPVPQIDGNENGDEQRPVLFYVCAASADAIVYVNGRRLQWQNRLHAGPDGSVPLHHHDRLSLGHCAYALLAVDPNAATSEHEVSFDTCVHEVVLQRSHGEREYQERLARFVVSKLRLPATRAAFEEQLLRAVHGASEANAVAQECGVHARFKVQGGGEVDLQRLYSLRLEDAMPHHAVKLSVAVVLLTTKEAACAEKQQQAAVLRAALNETSTDTSNSELNEESDSDDDDEEDDEDGAGHWGERARVILECSVDEFGDLVQNVKVCFARLKRVVRALRSAAEKRIKVAKLSELKKAKHQAKRSQVISAAGKAAKGLFSRKSSSDKIKGSDGGSDDEEATDEGELGEGEEQDEDDEDEREGNEAIAALSGSGAVVDDLIERAFLSCVHTRVPSSFTNMNPLTLDYRAGTAAAFSALGLGTSDGAGNDNDDGSSGSSGGNASGNTKGNAPRAYRDSALERDVGFALETVLDGDETAVDAATFERAVWVHCRRKVLDALQGPWMPHPPPERAIRRFVGVPPLGAPLQSQAAATLALVLKGGGVRAEVDATIEHLSDQLAKAVRLREWDIAVEMEETLSLVRAEATALDTRLRAEQKAKEVARQEAKAQRRASLNSASSSSLDGRGSSVPPSQHGRSGGSMARSASAGRSSSVTRGATAPKIVAWRGGTQVKEVDSSSNGSGDGSRGGGGGSANDKGAMTTKSWGLFGNKGTPKKPADIAPVSGAIEAAIKAAQSADTQNGNQRDPKSPTSQLKRPVLKRPGSREGNNGEGTTTKTTGDTFRNPMLRSESPLSNASSASEDESTPTSGEISSIQAKKEAKEKAAGGPAVRPKAPSSVFGFKGRTKAL